MIKNLTILFSIFFTLAIFSGAQTTAARTGAAGEILAQLPDSEALMFVDAKRLFSDALPLLTANNPAQLADINRQIERFKQQTGIDARDFDMMAASLDFSPKLKSLFPPQGTLTLDPVILARSSNTNAAQFSSPPGVHLKLPSAANRCPSNRAIKNTKARKFSPSALTRAFAFSGCSI